MTDQIPHSLINDHPDINFRGMHLYGVILGPVELNSGWGSGMYKHERKPIFTDAVITCNWAGYICEYHLVQNGKLILERYLYPYRDAAATDVHEILHGNFYLVMKKRFVGKRTYIPFVDGNIATDPSSWIDEDKINIQRRSFDEFLNEIEHRELNDIISNKNNQEILSDLARFISKSKTKQRDKAIELFEEDLRKRKVSWIYIRYVVSAILTWPSEYKTKGEGSLQNIAEQLLEQANDPKRRLVKDSILKTIVRYFPNTDFAKRAEELLAQKS